MVASDCFGVPLVIVEVLAIVYLIIRDARCAMQP